MIRPGIAQVMSSAIAAQTGTGTSVGTIDGPARWVLLAACALALAGCASQPGPGAGPGDGRYFDPVLGVWASPRVIGEGEPVPHGGGGYLVGRPYMVGGRSYVPIANPRGYTVEGTASWYGDAFHGRRTANGEIFDKGSISAAHPTLPLPSYVRVTNLKNGWSMVVRVNDRGPYHGGRVMDVSQRVAETLDFKNAGTARIRVDYIGRAGLRGSDDAKLAATLRTDGAPAHLDGRADEGAQISEVAPPLAAVVPLVPPPLRRPLLHAALIARGREDPLAPLLPPPLTAPLPRPAPGRYPMVRDRFYRPLPAAPLAPVVSLPPVRTTPQRPLVSFSPSPELPRGPLFGAPPPKPVTPAGPGPRRRRPWPRRDGSDPGAQPTASENHN